MFANFWNLLYQFSPQLSSLSLKLRTVKFIYFFYSTYRNFTNNLVLYDIYLYAATNSSGVKTSVSRFLTARYVIKKTNSKSEWKLTQSSIVFTRVSGWLDLFGFFIIPSVPLCIHLLLRTSNHGHVKRIHRTTSSTLFQISLDWLLQTEVGRK